jgi:hypothetical protein
MTVREENAGFKFVVVKKNKKINKTLVRVTVTLLIFVYISD